MNALAENRHAILAIFAATYLGLALGRVPGLRLTRTGIAVLGAVAMMLASRMPTAEIAASVNWPTILLLFGFFVISAQLRLSGFYDRVASVISCHQATPAPFLAYIIAAAAGLSAVLNNDIVCYVLTPVVGAELLRRRINPVPFLIALAAASNIGAAATLIGNAQNMLIGSVAHLGFLDYSLWAAAPVAFGLIAVFLVARRGIGAAPAGAPEVPPLCVPAHHFDRYHSAKGLIVLAGVIAFFFTPVPREITVLVAVAIHLLSSKFRTEQLLALVDWPILLLFVALFVVSGTFQATGYAEELVHWMEHSGFDPGRGTNEALLTAGLSAAINNAPAVMLLIRMVPMAHASAGYIMAVANSFAGNAVLTASVANLIVVQQAKSLGIRISVWTFAAYGLPITAIALGGLIGWASLMGP